MKKIPHLYLAGIFITLGILLSIGFGYVYNPPLKPVPSSELSTNLKTFNATTYHAVVNAVHFDSTGDQVYKPGDNYQFVVIDVSLSNTSKTPITISPVVQMSVRDEKGQIYHLSPAPLDTPLPYTELSTLQTIRGEVSFSVPTTSKSLTFIFDPAPAAGKAGEIGL